VDEATGSRAYTPGNVEEVKDAVHEAMDRLEELSRNFQAGKVNTSKFWNIWNQWDEIGKQALASLKPYEQQEVILSRQTLNITGFPSSPNPKK
jgi:hypothetical protein